MTRDEAKSVLFDMLGKGIYVKDTKENQAILVALRALEQEPCEDAVSREAVEDIVMWYDGQGEMLDEIQKLPSVQTKPKTGQWEWVQYDYNPKLGNWHCSECRCVVVECVDKNEKGGIPLYKYCPQCGAKMVEPQAESKEKTCKNCINAKECVMYDPSMKRCKGYKADPKEIYNRGFADGQKALAEHLKLCKEEKGWISVNERLPDTDDDVLVYDGADMYVAWYARKGMWQGWNSHDNSFERDTPITAWMPLPEPYKAESEDKE